MVNCICETSNLFPALMEHSVSIRQPCFKNKYVGPLRLIFVPGQARGGSCKGEQGYKAALVRAVCTRKWALWESTGRYHTVQAGHSARFGDLTAT